MFILVFLVFKHGLSQNCLFQNLVETNQVPELDFPKLAVANLNLLTYCPKLTNESW